MNCPVCDRSLAPTLSICPTCGAMRNDTVREELQTKVSSGNLSRAGLKTGPEPERRTPPPRPSMIAPPPARIVSPPIKRQETAGLVASKTSPTLVEFQNKNASLPDWRIQVPNADQHRRGGHADAVAKAALNTDTQFPTNGGAALKAEVVQRAEPAPAPQISDPRVASAMRRIEESRKAFLEPAPAPRKFAAPKPAQLRPFGVVSTNSNTSAAVAPARINAPLKPT